MSATSTQSTLSPEGSARFARLDRLQREIADLVDDLRDRELNGQGHALVVMGTRQLEISLEGLRRKLAEVAR
jgi:predicted transcriptional regulator